MLFKIPKVRRAALLTAAVMVCTCLLAFGASAADREVLYNADYCFSTADFLENDSQLTGVFITDVPSATLGTVHCGARVIRAGDALPADALSALIFSPCCQGEKEATVSYLPVTESGVGTARTLKINISSGKNDAPTAKDTTLETYKNVANSGTLEVTDPEGGKVRCDLIKAPQRGTVELNEDGTFTYTPAKNKVGKDSFTYTATDDAGNVSNEATVRVEILKPTDKLTYSDMSGDPDQFTALWLKNNGLYAGESIGGVACFCPEKPVSRGEFLVMVSKLTGLEPDQAEMVSGFADEAEIPAWMRPYIVSALRAGVITGTGSEDGLVFRPDAALTSAEAAVMLRNALHLPDARETAAFPEDSTVPAWAESAVSALSSAGLPADLSDGTETITRRQAANMLYAVAQHQKEAGLGFSF